MENSQPGFISKVVGSLERIENILDYCKSVYEIVQDEKKIVSVKYLLIQYYILSQQVHRLPDLETVKQYAYEVFSFTQFDYFLFDFTNRNKDYTIQFDFVENSLSTFLGDQILDKKLLGEDYFSYVKNHFSEFEMEFRIKNGYTGSPADFTQYHVEAGIRQIKFRLYY